MEGIVSVIVVIIAIVSMLAKLSQKTAKPGAQKPAAPITPYAEPDEPDEDAPAPTAETITPVKKSGLDAFTDMLRKLDIEVPDISGITGETKNSAVAQPRRDPAPRPGHETHDPTEGSIELDKRSPEGAGELPRHARAGTARPESGRPQDGAGEQPYGRRPRQTEPATMTPNLPRIDSAQLRNAVVMAEVLARPVTLRKGVRRI